MPKIRLITQLELEGFAETVKDAEEAGGVLSAAEIQTRSMAAKQALGTDKIPVYFEQYHRLMDAGVPWKIAAYVAWASIPKHDRNPSTQDEFAKQVLGLNSDRQISEWRKKYPIDQMVADLSGEMLLQYRPGVFEAIGWGASQKSYRAAAQQQLFVELSRDMPNPRIHVEDNRVVQDLEDLSDAQLDAMDAFVAKDMLKRIRDDERKDVDETLAGMSDEDIDAALKGNDDAE
jgi:hypothetical protein